MPARPKRADGEATRNNLLEAAGDLFALHGFAETSSKAIALKAGADLASINYHFGGRAGLYRQTLAEAHHRLFSIDRIRDIVCEDLPASERLRRLIETLINSTGNGKSWPGRLLAREILAPSPHLLPALDAEVQGKLALLLGLLSEITGMASDDPGILRCAVSVAAPCLMLIVATERLPGPAGAVTQMPHEAVIEHLHRFAMAGLTAVSPVQEVSAV